MSVVFVISCIIKLVVLDKTCFAKQLFAQQSFDIHFQFLFMVDVVGVLVKVNLATIKCFTNFVMYAYM